MSVKMNLDGLDELLKNLKGPIPTIKVGVLGSNQVRAQEGEEEVKSNAAIGRFHEFGLGNNPERSFLRMPLIMKLDEELKNSGFFNKKTFAQALKEDGIFTIMNKIGILSVRIVEDAFDSEGFGMWPSSDMSTKENEQTLTETGQLRRSISYEVSND
tara:strand:- start:27502 stop:27972 length:471 start_codon:yes stop_codon:yes gene_type:complete